MKKQVNNFISVSPSGHGHKKITAYLLSGEQLTTITSDMRMVDMYNSDDDEDIQRGKEKLIEYVLSANGIEEYEILK